MAEIAEKKTGEAVASKHPHEGYDLEHRKHRSHHNRERSHRSREKSKSSGRSSHDRDRVKRDKSVDNHRHKERYKHRGSKTSEGDRGSRDGSRRRRLSRENSDGTARGRDRSDSIHSRHIHDYLHHGSHRSPKGHRSSRSHRDRSRSSNYERHRSITPLHLWKRKLNNWDTPPPEFPGISARRLKESGVFPARAAMVSLEDSSYATIHEREDSGACVAGQLAYSSHGVSPGRSGRSSEAAEGIRQGSCGSTAGGSLQSNISRQARRLYIGNLPYDIAEDALVDFLNQTMVQWNLAKTGATPVVFAQINHDKSFAFVEFRTLEEATDAMALDCVSLAGQSLKIRRPKDYQPPPGSSTYMPSIHVPGVVSTNVPDSSNKIFVGGLPTFLSEDQVMELLKSFGELKAFNLVRDNVHGTSKGFAFCEYADPSVTDSACSGLNGMEVGEKRLIVQRASVGAGARCGTPAASSFPPPIAHSIPSKTLILFNMVTFEDLVDENEYQDIIGDIREECEKFGEVVSVKIPLSSDNNNYPGLAKVYIEFTSNESCTKALNSLAGRKFLDRTVMASYCNQPVPA